MKKVKTIGLIDIYHYPDDKAHPYLTVDRGTLIPLFGPIQNVWSTIEEAIDYAEKQNKTK